MYAKGHKKDTTIIEWWEYNIGICETVEQHSKNNQKGNWKQL